VSESRRYIPYAPGIFLTAHALPLENPSPAQAEIREAPAGNFCRCIGAGRLAPNPQEET
jgi:aerobic-type carbon monoxide dehydrogenase small subunit (CoxS/CutS family)